MLSSALFLIVFASRFVIGFITIDWRSVVDPPQGLPSAKDQISAIRAVDSTLSAMDISKVYIFANGYGIITAVDHDFAYYSKRLFVIYIVGDEKEAIVGIWKYEGGKYFLANGKGHKYFRFGDPEIAQKTAARADEAAAREKDFEHKTAFVANGNDASSNWYGAALRSLVAGLL